MQAGGVRRPPTVESIPARVGRKRVACRRSPLQESPSPGQLTRPLSQICASARRQGRQPQRLQRAGPVPQVSAEDRAGHRQQSVGERRVHASPARHRGQEGEAQHRVLRHVAVRVQVDVLAPIARVHQPLVRVAVHPAVAGVVVLEREMGSLVAQRLAHRDPFQIQPVGHRPHRGLRAFVVNVPALEVLQRRRVHQDQRRMDDGSGVHQRAGQRVLAGLDHRVGFADDREGVLRAFGGIGPGGQPRGADGDAHLVGRLLACEVGQRAGLRPGDLGARAGRPDDLAHDIAAEGARRQEHHLAVLQVRCERARDVLLRRGGRRDQHQLRAAHRLGEVRGGARDRNSARPTDVRDLDGAAVEHRLQRGRIAPPQPHLVPLLAQVRRGCVAAVASSQHCDLQVLPPNSNSFDHRGHRGHGGGPSDRCAP